MNSIKTELSDISAYNHLQKILEKLPKLRKSCNHKRNIKRLYNEKLHHNYLQQLPTLRLKTSEIREFGWKEIKKSNCSLVPSPLPKN